MRIKEIEIKNFKALARKYNINLTNSCKNLLVYGENGSGKSSFCQAIKVFFNASTKETNISEYKNIFIKDNQNPDGYNKLTFREDANKRAKTYQLDQRNMKINEQFISEANKRKAFLDYKQLMKTHLIDFTEVDLFELLVKNLLYHSINPVNSKSIGISIEYIDSVVIDRRKKEFNKLLSDIEDFNVGFKKLLEEIEQEANDIIQEFNYNIKIHLNFKNLTLSKSNKIIGHSIKLGIDFYDKPNLKNHYDFLNEARLTAIAIAIYLGSIKNIPSSKEYKILVLDDIFIGLDTSNRMPLLKILDQKFSDYQIIIATYDKHWYELVKLYTADRDWVYAEMYLRHDPIDGYEFPIIYCDNTDFLDKADYYINEGDLKASAVYVRSAFERELANFCNKKRIPVRFVLNPSKINVEDLWCAIKDYKITTNTDKGKKIQVRLIDEDLRDNIQNQRSLVMNPYSHFDINQPQFKSELELTIDLVKKLRKNLKEEKLYN